ncbi:MAG: exo-alpha-sialidase [Fimbriimonadaceae bacterium]|nr:exo-alpha-sialidase [Fimbriimonadaceae bacterium]
MLVPFLAAALLGGMAPLKIVVFGDSTTALRTGVHLVYADRLAEELASQGIASQIVNAGVGGNTTRQAVARLEHDVLARDPDLVIIQFGLNDSAVDVLRGRTEPRVSRSEYEWNLRTIIRRIKERGGEPILATPNPGIWSERLLETYGQPPYDVNDRWGFNVYNARYAESVRRIAKETDVPLVDVYRMYEAQDRNPEKIEGWLSDGLHPNDEGHRALAAVLARRVADLLALNGHPRVAGTWRAVVRNGVPLGAEADGWSPSPEGLVGNGPGNRLVSRVSIGDGDFRITARLKMDDQKGSAAAFFLDDSVFGFEGAKETLFVSGGAFGDLQLLQPSEAVFKRGAWIAFEASRQGGTLTCSIDGKVVASAPDSGPVHAFGFDPFRSRMTVESLEVRGELEDREVSQMARGYTIPTLDLSGDKSRQFVVDREEGQYLGHPTTVLLEDGKTILTVFPKGHGRGPIVLKRSEDGGKTWSERLSTPENWATSLETPTIHRTIDPRTGKRRLIVFSGLYPIRRAVSEDDGATWSPLEKVGDFGGIVAMASVARLSNGDYAAWFHDDGRFFANSGKATSTFTLYQTVSGDGGLTWEAPRAIWSGSDVHLCEPGVVRSPDGRQLALLLRENSRRRNSFVMFSNDEAQTWTAPRELPAALTGDRHTAKYLPDGRLFISFRDTTRESPTQGDWVAWVGTYDDIVDRREGQYRVRLMDNQDSWDCAYPGVEVLPDGTIATTTYGHWEAGKEPYVVCVRLRVEELDALAKQGKLLGAAPDTALFQDGLDGAAEVRSPSLAATPHALVAVAEARRERAGDLPNNIDLVMRRSTDGGQTWSAVETIVDPPGTEGASRPQLTYDSASGVLWLAYTYGSRGLGTQESRPGFGVFETLQLLVRRSEDDGATWSDAVNITTQVKQRAWRALWTSPGSGAVLRSGRIVLPATAIDENGIVQSRALLSDDHGRSWRCSKLAAAGAVDGAVVEREDGSLLLSMGSLQGVGLRAHAASSDGGETWEAFDHDPWLIAPPTRGGLAVAEDGTWVFSGPADTLPRRLALRVSHDQGATWAMGTVVQEGPAGASSLTRVGKKVGVLYEAGPAIRFRWWEGG